MPNFLPWNTVEHALNANFTSSIIGALAGAFAGAKAAQKIAARDARIEALTREIRSTNSAITLAYTICNSGIDLKRKYVDSIFTTYLEKKVELERLHQTRNLGSTTTETVYELQVDLRTLHMPYLPIGPLQNLLYERISVCGRPAALAAALAGTIASLAQMVQVRSALINRFQSIRNQQTVLALYFGLPYGDGHLDTQFPDTVVALRNSTDDMIYFSDLLIQDLTKHGDGVVIELKRTDKSNRTRIQRVDFKEARERGWIPSSANYGDWDRAFVDASQPSTANRVDTTRQLFRRLGRRR